jgi:hypothetical protein
MRANLLPQAQAWVCVRIQSASSPLHFCCHGAHFMELIN